MKIKNLKQTNKKSIDWLILMMNSIQTRFEIEFVYGLTMIMIIWWMNENKLNLNSCVGVVDLFYFYFDLVNMHIMYECLSNVCVMSSFILVC